MKSWKNISILSLSPSAMAVLLSGCLFGENKTFFDYKTGTTGAGNLPDQSPISDPSHTDTNTSTSTGTSTGTDTSTATGTNTNTGTALNTALTTESFLAATSEVKKIDFLFVVDNSGSMADNQQALADGFEAFANTFYRRADLDICTSIITTDRYLGKVGAGGYQRERTLNCTKPAGWNAMTAAQQTTYIDNLIADFKNKVNVGTHGSGTELTGKSLVSYLYDLNAWGDPVVPAIHTSFFRPDAVANISILTDENNWYFDSPNEAENMNDLPAVTNAVIYNSNSGAVDSRKGIKNYLDEFFTAAQPSHGLSYSVTSFLEITQPATTVPGISMNLSSLTTLVGRESALADVEDNATAFADTYNSVADSIVQRAAAFNVVHDIYEPLFPTLADLTVTIVKADATRVDLSLGSNYSVLMPNGIVLDQATSNSTSIGDHIEVHYRYDTAH